MAHEASIKTQMSQIQAEKQLEVQRLKSQISSQGLIATSTRMAGGGQAEVALAGKLAAAEAQTSAARSATWARQHQFTALNKLKARAATLAVTEANMASAASTHCQRQTQEQHYQIHGWCLGLALLAALLSLLIAAAGVY